MAEFTRAFIEGLAKTCTAPEGVVRIDRESDPLQALSARSYQDEIAELRTRLLSTDDEIEPLERTAYEWFLDNFYLITETAQTLAEDLPANFYRELPSMRFHDDGAERRLPRIYVLASELFTELSSPPNRSTLESFLSEFQRYQPLDIGELWAFPAMVRAVCLEHVVGSLSSLSAPSEGDETELLVAMKCESAKVAFAIRTLIELKTIPWRSVFERTSLVHKELLLDPAGVYPSMDFATCDRYRRAIEQLALGAGCTEFDAVSTANALAGAQEGDPKKQRLRRHVGYYLIDAGRPELERVLHVRLSRSVRLGRFLRRYATPVYLSSIASLTCGLMALVATYAWSVGAGPLTVALACVLAFIPSSAFAIAWVQWAITKLLSPERLPRLALEGGITDDNRSIVVIPTLLGGLDEIHDLVQRLELHYLANPDPNLRFAILADYTDALTETTASDGPLLERARAGITLLNQKYGDGNGGQFHLLIRNRHLNKSQGVWMGWERKRGKLEEFNRLLAGHADTTYSTHVGQRSGLEGIRFVITLDSDTELPRDAAKRLVATLAHPLNRAQFDEGRITSGYTVLQPRIDISPEASHRSRFSRVFAGDTGLDIYSRAVSNVYQDFFGSGVYVGKGIYDVDAFSRCLEGRVPENALLSHDLFEGIYGRAGLVSDVVLYEDYPPSYLTYARRLHRWIRGDWQLVPWLGRRVPTGAGASILNPFSHIDRWKVVDNLRRSLLPIAQLALFLSGWTWLPGNAFVWTGLTLLLSAGHVLTGLASQLSGLFYRPFRTVRASLSSVPNDLYRWLLSLAFLPHEAVIVTDAILRTGLRMSVTRKRLLEWTTAAHTATLMAKRGQRSLLWWEMLGGPVCALGVAGVLIARPDAFPAAAVFLVLWFVSPEISLFLAKPMASKTDGIGPDEVKLMRQLSRRTWLFFETFVGPDDHWLPPDNVQLVPQLRVAHRTSPTNIGLYLASCASAYDLGYLGLRDFCVRVQMTLRTLEQLQRHRGQLLNWYETQTLEPLLPRYVSTVDNGNFAAALIAVRQACGDFATAPMFRRQSFAALGDVIDLLAGCLCCPDTPQQLDPAIERDVSMMRLVLAQSSNSPDRWLLLLDELELLVEGLSRTLEAMLEEEGDTPIAVEFEARDWLEVLTREISSMRASIQTLAGWYYSLLEPPPSVRYSSERRMLLRALRDEVFSVGLENMRGLAVKVERFFQLGKRKETDRDPEAIAWAENVRGQLAAALAESDALLSETLDVGVNCESEIAKMDFGFLYDTEANQMFIGYDASSSQPDHHHYDLLASEARLASLVAIALDQVPTKHWAHLGRPVSTGAMLLSWSGTMFEYLMPLLFTRSFPKTLLGRSTTAAVKRQIQYGQHRRVPWGISESAFASTDSKGDYQYRAFGAPGLGLKRGLEEDLVVAPYASVLAVEIQPRAVAANLVTFQKLGAWGEYGALEAVDFTPGRSRYAGRPVSSEVGGPSGTVVQAYMAHHQGMSMVAIGNLLAGASMKERFHADPRVQTVAHLLQEKLPATITSLELSAVSQSNHAESSTDRVVFAQPWRPVEGGSVLARRLVDPSMHVLSNGHLNLSYDSFGRSRLWLTHGHEEVDVRSNEAGTSHDRMGSFCLYLDGLGNRRELLSGGLGAHPETRSREVTFWPHKVESHSRFESLAVLEQVFIAAHDNVEIRSVRLTNEGSESVDVGVIGYAEVSLQNAEEHHRHPAFSRLFLQSSVLEHGKILLCRRRPRGPGERYPVVAQAVLDQGPIPATPGKRAWETSREAFIGRGGSLEDPQWSHALARTNAHEPGLEEGRALDPCLVQRVAVTLAPGESQSIAWITAVGIDEERALEAVAPYMQLSALTTVHDQTARAMAQRLGLCHISAQEVALFQRLVSRLVHRSTPSVPGAVRSRLWGYGVSGDRPMLVLHRRSEESQLVLQLLRAHRFFVEQNFVWDLVVLVHDATGYVDQAREQIRRIARTVNIVNLHASVNIVSAGQLRVGDLEILDAAAGVVLDTDAGELEVQLSGPIHQPKAIPPFVPTRPTEDDGATPPLVRQQDLLFDNELGGFDQKTSEYVLFLGGSDSTRHTPAPWCNVLSNPRFGTLVSERGLGCTWAENASENRLSPWSNDPVCDPPSEAVYLRDEETGQVWSPTPAPMDGGLPYEVAHGIGYTRYRHRSHGLMQTLDVSVHADEPVKIVALTLENVLDRPRRVTCTYFVDWVLGGRSATHGAFVVPRFDPDANAIFASNPWNVVHPDQAAFVASSEKVHGFTVDPVEFLGGGGSRNPDALRRWGLSNSDKTGALACGVLQVHLDLEPGERKQLHFAVGWGSTAEEAATRATRSTSASFVAEAKTSVEQHWGKLLGRVSVSTPDPETDLMLNTWALYQTVSSRLYARTGFYQSSGAIGFRDQLQDVMSLCTVVPQLAREHILTAAAHQFEAGDVLHWWHPPKAQGVRTRCSDDLLWLPCAVTRYIETTGDMSILEEQVGFLTGSELEPAEHDRYAVFTSSDDSASLYDHCHRALDRAHAVGEHGLPLIGGGDWNDGMNLVGVEGRGESVWLGWFLYRVMDRFAGIAVSHQHPSDALDLRRRCEELVAPLEAAWDGSWYRRAYYDDGSPLGAATAREARIDSISQSWAVLSGAAPEERAREAVTSAVEELVDTEGRLIRLLWPPFDVDRQEPGYIKGYPPGIRENGAQYTHAATWLVWALFALKDNREANKLYKFLNPITHSLNLEQAHEYAAEPYVLAGDVYSTGKNRGRAGWSWYTGAAAWYWRIGVEELLGCRVVWPFLELSPCIPEHWPGCKVTLRLDVGTYEIEIENRAETCDGVLEVLLDGRPLAIVDTPRIDLREHPSDHTVRVVLTAKTQKESRELQGVGNVLDVE